MFVGAVGRTDLPGGSPKQLLASIREKIYTLPGSNIVWPGHDYGPYPIAVRLRKFITVHGVLKLWRIEP